MADSNIPDKYTELARKWLDGSATPAEKEEYDAWYTEFDDEGLLIPQERGTSDEEVRARLFGKIINRIREEGSVRPLWIRLAVAASVTIMLLSAGVLFYLKFQNDTEAQLASQIDNDEIYFAGDKATLELADGSQVNLDELSDGTKLNQGTAFLTKLHDRVVYQNVGTTKGKPEYNIIRVPRGGQFRIVLSDGTQIWLNSASSLKFPVSFNDTARIVELLGEAYFEVAKRQNNGASTSFKIHVVEKQTVEVLGTQFNVMAYNQEAAIRTTLIKGRVKVSKYGDAEGIVLKPLQQAAYAGGGYQIKSGVDPSEAVSWKEGVIRYTDADIQTIMRQIERWYDVNVSYEGNLPQRNFNGGLSRTSPLSQVLKILEINDIHVRREGRRLVVLTEYSPKPKL